MRRCQVSNEFLILIGVVYLTLLLFLYYSADTVKDIAFKKEFETVRDIGFFVQHELFLATEVNDGYLRQFEIPGKYNGIDYNITIMGSTLVVMSANNGIEQPFQVPLVVGNLTKGMNNISRRGGVVYLNE